MTIEEAITQSGFLNRIDKGSRKYAQKSLAEDESLLFAYNGNFAVVPSDTKLDPGKVYSIKNKLCGILAVTDRRIFACSSTLGESIFKEIPLKQVQSMDEASSALFGTAQLRIKGLTEVFIIDLNKKQKAHINECKSIISSAMAAMPHSGSSIPAPDTIADQLMKYKELLDAGLITKKEFDQQKAKLLG